MSYDLIGDVHGHAEALITLLGALGYRRRDGAFRHPDRRAVFVGDFIDRGPRNREVVGIVRAMVERGSALAVLGNHELSAIRFWARGPDGEPLRPRTTEQIAQHRTFLDEYERDEHAWAEAIAWFRTLPVFLDLGALRIVHAYWSDAQLAAIAPSLDDGGRITDAGLAESVTAAAETTALDTLLHGPEFTFPDGVSFIDRQGRERRKARIRWWAPRGARLRDALLLPPGFDQPLPDAPLEALDGLLYPDDAPPVFFGHYWLRGRPRALRGNIACLDYSVARWGQLVAYRWDGEARLDAEKFIGVQP